MYRSFVSLGRYTPKYFILFVAMVNGIVSLISFSVSYMQNRKRDTDVQNRILDSVGEGEGGMF